ncbi:23803_t:CDS:2 [Gigaspora margarita]|uniref:23803_t:CDS:1 n=1 Tax=Gigaspora margarita TaxID=4874 RepID=A0ABN7VBF6_GIGMA|nr:23803_t:CDS:2 [Gigaspora margarita]
MYNKQKFTPKEIEAFEDEIMKELFTKNLDQLKYYRFYLSLIEVQNNINEKYFSQMKIYYEYYDFVNNSKKAQEYSQKLKELHDCK